MVGTLLGGGDRRVPVRGRSGAILPPADVHNRDPWLTESECRGEQAGSEFLNPDHDAAMMRLPGRGAHRLNGGWESWATLAMLGQKSVI